MKTNLNLTGLAITLCSVASINVNAATVITVTDLGWNSLVSDTGSASIVSNTGIGNSRTYSYAISGLNLANDSTSDDTFNFSVTLLATTGGSVLNNGYANAVNHWGVDTGAGVSDGGQGPNEISAGEGLSFSFGASSIVYGDNSGSASLSSSLFDGLTLRFSGGDTISLSGATWNTGSTTLPTGSEPVVDFDSSVASFGFVNDNATGGGFLGGKLDMTFTIVPEPSSTALIGLGGLAMILRRRRL